MRCQRVTDEQCTSVITLVWAIIFAITIASLFVWVVMLDKRCASSANKCGTQTEHGHESTHYPWGGPTGPPSDTNHGPPDTISEAVFEKLVEAYMIRKRLTMSPRRLEDIPMVLEHKVNVAMGGANGAVNMTQVVTERDPWTVGFPDSATGCLPDASNCDCPTTVALPDWAPEDWPVARFGAFPGNRSLVPTAQRWRLPGTAGPPQCPDSASDGYTHWGTACYRQLHAMSNDNTYNRYANYSVVTRCALKWTYTRTYGLWAAESGH